LAEEIPHIQSLFPLVLALLVLGLLCKRLALEVEGLLLVWRDGGSHLCLKGLIGLLTAVELGLLEDLRVCPSRDTVAYVLGEL
jgi:hypothetical protein